MKKRKTKQDCKIRCDSPRGCGYFLGVIGAAIYYIGQSTSFWMGVLGVLKAIVWPVFLIYEVLKYLAV